MRPLGSEKCSYFSTYSGVCRDCIFSIVSGENIFETHALNLHYFPDFMYRKLLNSVTSQDDYRLCHDSRCLNFEVTQMHHPSKSVLLFYI